MVEQMKDYIEYLNSIDEGKIKYNSKNSYVVYLSNLCKRVLNPYINKNLINNLEFLDLFYSLNKTYRIKLLTLAENHIKEILEDDKYIKSKVGVVKKTLQNYQSAFRCFINMGCEYEEKAKNKHLESTIIQQKIDEEYSKIGKIIYTKKELDSIYIARLKTQDREYEEISFPIRVVWKFAKRDGIEKQLYNIMKITLDKMIYYVSNDGNRRIYHKDIKKLTLDLKNNCVEINKEKMYTKTAKEGKFVLQQPIMSNISIDHKTSLHTLLSGGNEVKYNKLYELSKAMKEFKYTKNGTKAARAIEFYDANMNNVKMNKEFVKDLVDELGSLFDKMQFVAMDKAQNSSKNDNI